jgi:two-component system cell cycle response regulator CpdR
MFRILLAEDEQVMHAYLAQALERSGYKVVAFDRGTAASPCAAARQ